MPIGWMGLLGLMMLPDKLMALVTPARSHCDGAPVGLARLSPAFAGIDKPNTPRICLSAQASDVCFFILLREPMDECSVGQPPVVAIVIAKLVLPNPACAICRVWLSVASSLHKKTNVRMKY